MSEQGNGAPFKVFPYRADRRWSSDDVFTIQSPQALKLYLSGFALVHIESGRTLVIEDCDGYCVFRAEGGRMVYPVVPE